MYDLNIQCPSKKQRKFGKQNVNTLLNYLYPQLKEHLSSSDRWDRCILRESERERERERERPLESVLLRPSSSHLCSSDGRTDRRTAVIHNQTAAASGKEEEEEKDNHALCTLIALVKTRKMLLPRRPPESFSVETEKRVLLFRSLVTVGISLQGGWG